MPRFFNTTGPCNPGDHYTLPAERRIPDLIPYIDRKQYFVVHAARQTGKTTTMRAVAERLRARGDVAVWATLEESQGVEDTGAAEPIWLRALHDAGRRLPPGAAPPDPQPVIDREPGARLRAYLSLWAERIDRPLVLLLDEADVIRGPALISFLRQLRAGFMDRGAGRFPTSIGLIGMRDLRDYLTESKDGVPVNPGSPFNIKAASFTLHNFTLAETKDLLSQHTAETGQPFEEDASSEIFRLTQGQPFLVNWLADQCVTYLATDRAAPVTQRHVDDARERLILSRTTHLDALAQRLREPRVARIVEAALLGDAHDDVAYSSDAFQYVVDLGLLRKAPHGVEAANPLYREVLARELSFDVQSRLPAPWWPWARPDGRLDFPALIAAFRPWWRENADVLRDKGGEYVEAVPHLALMAFLQRVVNGGGRVHREFSAGRGRLDLLVEYGPDRFVVECKRVRVRDGLDKVKADGIRQLSEYLDTVGLSEGWLVLFDVRPDRSWDERVWTEDIDNGDKRIHLVGA